MSDDGRARDALWQGIRVMLDRLIAEDADPTIVADLLALAGATEGRLWTELHDIAEASGWHRPAPVDQVHADVSLFAFYAQRLAERMQLEVVAVPVDAPVSAVSAAVAPLYARRTGRRVTRVVAVSEPPAEPWRSTELGEGSTITLTDEDGRAATFDAAGAQVEMDASGELPRLTRVTLDDAPDTGNAPSPRVILRRIACPSCEWYGQVHVFARDPLRCPSCGQPAEVSP